MKIILKKLLLKNLLISLNGLVLIDLLTVYPNKIFAKDFDKNRLKEISINFNQSGLNNFDYNFQISNTNLISKKEVVKDLKVNGKKLFNLLAFEKNNFKKINFLDINSDVQYREKEVFHAEGNAIINFSNGSLRGDLIKYDLQNKLLTVVGNVIFKKGQQYFEASKLYYDLKENNGYINDIYGVLDKRLLQRILK